jgi:hypothetical protein
MRRIVIGLIRVFISVYRMFLVFTQDVEITTTTYYAFQLFKTVIVLYSTQETLFVKKMFSPDFGIQNKSESGR